MIRRITALAALLVCFVALSACGSEPRPGTSKDDYRASQNRSHAQAENAKQQLNAME